MQKRQKVILAVMFIAVTYGVYSLFFSSPSKTGSVDSGKEIEELNNLVTVISKDLSNANVSGAYKHIIARAEAEWESDPFLETGLFMKSEVASQAEGSEQGVSFIYSGYLAVGSERFAIINGIEYEKGEELVLGGYVVHSISPNEVVIKVKGKLDKLVVSLVKELL